MKPAMAKGIAAKYRIPELKPLPASWPIWLAVLVQIEHCATALITTTWDSIKKVMRFIKSQRVKLSFWVLFQFLQRVLQQLLLL